MIMHNCAMCSKLIDEETVFISVTKWVNGAWRDFCRTCVEPNKFKCPEITTQIKSGYKFPDVYFDPSKGSNQIDPNLCDRYTGPIPFSSKQEKAAVMKQLGLREAGDKEHGSRNFDRTANRNNWK
jgi:hypothetical protein